jgi:hypothetical protein
MYNILNCPNHQFHAANVKPINGHLYYSEPEIQEKAIYSGYCGVPDKKDYMVALEGIYSNKEFYTTELSNTSTGMPEYLSTLYWKHALRLQKGKTATISFYTADITEKFRVIVQGRPATDVVYWEYFFDVKN